MSSKKYEFMLSVFGGVYFLGRWCERKYLKTNLKKPNG
jgi:hypothetical protein